EPPGSSRQSSHSPGRQLLWEWSRRRPNGSHASIGGMGAGGLVAGRVHGVHRRRPAPGGAPRSRPEGRLSGAPKVGAGSDSRGELPFAEDLTTPWVVEVLNHGPLTRGGWRSASTESWRARSCWRSG